jgi:hypothetical protein
MADRRPLVEGLKSSVPPVDSEQERRFVYGKPNGKSDAGGGVATATMQARSPISTRIRADFAAALKRASLQRQLEGVKPNTLQEFLEEAIEPWLKSNGYLP